MKRAGSLLPRIADPDNIRLAFWKASRGKRGRGAVLAFAGSLEERVAAIRGEIVSGEPRLGRYRFFHVRDPKRRLICAASFPERVFHHALMNVCEPELERGAIFDSYACRKGKGMRLALARAHRFSREHPWYLKLDVRKYFDSIDHETALGLLARRIKDRAVLDLFARALATYSTAPGKGVPIGNLISQHLANFYLSSFDHWVKEERGVRGYVRYMDDLLLFGDGSDGLKGLLGDARSFLRERLALELREPPQINRTEHGIPFLGYRVFPGRIGLAPRSRHRFVERLVACGRRLAHGVWDEEEAARHAEAFVDFTRPAAAGGFRRSVIARYGAAS